MKSCEKLKVKPSYFKKPKHISIGPIIKGLMVSLFIYFIFSSFQHNIRTIICFKIQLCLRLKMSYVVQLKLIKENQTKSTSNSLIWFDFPMKLWLC